MLGKLIVQSYTTLIEIGLWFFVISGLVSGYMANGILGALVGLVGSVLFAAVFMGAFLILGDIHRAVLKIEESATKKAQ